MIYSSNRVPGQLLPVGARYWGNAGKPLDALKTVAGLSGVSSDFGQTLTSEEAAALIMSEGSIAPETPATITTTTQAKKAAAAYGGGLVFAALVIRGGLGYLAGRAMAPTAAKKNSYGMWGILAGGVFGVTGLAVQGAVALSKK